MFTMDVKQQNNNNNIWCAIWGILETALILNLLFLLYEISLKRSLQKIDIITLKKFQVCESLKFVFVATEHRGYGIWSWSFFDTYS